MGVVGLVNCGEVVEHVMAVEGARLAAVGTGGPCTGHPTISYTPHSKDSTSVG